MFAHINLDFFVNNILLNMSLSVVRFYVGVIISPGKVLKFLHIVSWMRCVSACCGLILETTLP